MLNLWLRKWPVSLPKTTYISHRKDTISSVIWFWLLLPNGSYPPHSFQVSRRGRNSTGRASRAQLVLCARSRQLPHTRMRTRGVESGQRVRRITRDSGAVITTIGVAGIATAEHFSKLSSLCRPACMHMQQIENREQNKNKKEKCRKIILGWLYPIYKNKTWIFFSLSLEASILIFLEVRGITEE